MFPIRGIGENEIVGGGIPLEMGGDFRLDDTSAIKPGFGQILADDITSLAVFIDKRASRPIAPEPAKRSSTRAFSTRSLRIEKIA